MKLLLFAAPSFWGGRQDNSTEARNKFYREWVQALPPGASAKVLPGDRMAASGGIERNTQDKTHYGCIFHKDFHLGLEVAADIMKTPASGDCRDHFNLNVIFMILKEIRCASTEN